MLLAILFLAAASAPSQSASPVASPRSLERFVDAPSHDPVDVRYRELLARRATVTAYQLDEHGAPRLRLDVHSASPFADERAARELLERFEDSESSSSGKIEDAPWRRTVLVSAEPALEPADMAYFDPEGDVVVTFRPLQLALSCSSGSTVQASLCPSTGTNSYWYFSGDAVTGAAGPNRCSCADPDLYLHWWNGSSWAFLGSSTAVSTLDSVGAFNPGCYSNNYRLRAYAYVGGCYSVRAGRFIAN